MKKSRLYPAILFIFLLSAVLVWPLLRPGFWVSDDGEWMVIRLSAFYQSLAEGQFPVRFLGRLNYGYGYPVANFLYPGFLYMGSVIHVFGVPFSVTVKLILIASILLTSLLLYFALRRQFGSRASILGVGGFLFFPYLAYDLYKRGSVGEIVALAPASLFLFALQTNRLWLTGPAVAFLILAHNSVAFMLLPVLILLAYAKKHLYASLPYIVTGIGSAAFFWIPAFFEKRFTVFDRVAVSDPLRYFATSEFAVLLGFATVLAWSLAWGVRKKTGLLQPAWYLTALGYVLALPISTPLWQIPALGFYVQFPYRFLVIPLILGPWVFAAAYERLRGRVVYVFVLVCAVLWVHGVAVYQSRIKFVDRPETYYTTNEASTTVLDEYMPLWVQTKPTTHNPSAFEVLSGDASIDIIRATTQTIELAVDARTESIVQINRTFYPGWGVVIDGMITRIYHVNPRGLIQVVVPGGEHRVLAQFRETRFRFTADVISLVSAVFFLIFAIRSKKTYA